MSRAPHKGDPRRRNGHRRDQLKLRALAVYDTCCICGQPIDKTLKYPDPMSASLDEHMPVSKGGDPLDWSNIGLAHLICNIRRQNKPITTLSRQKIPIIPSKKW